jgi:hypothetical protein
MPKMKNGAPDETRTADLLARRLGGCVTVSSCVPFKIEMRIAIDTHAIGSRLTGNERYIANLAEQLLRIDHENEYVFFLVMKKPGANGTAVGPI